jgi:hypothetical protein
MINFFFASWQFLCLTAILLARICLTVFFASWQFTSPGNIIIDLASPGQYHHKFGLTAMSLRAVVSSILPHRHAPLDNILFYLALLAILSSILPHGHAPPAILFSIQPNSHTILENYFSIWPHSCASPGKILLITHQGFLGAAFFKLPCTHSYLVLQGFHSSALVLLFLQHHATNSLLHPF